MAWASSRISIAASWTVSSYRRSAASRLIAGRLLAVGGDDSSSNPSFCWCWPRCSGARFDGGVSRSGRPRRQRHPAGVADRRSVERHGARPPACRVGDRRLELHHSADDVSFAGLHGQGVDARLDSDGRQLQSGGMERGRRPRGAAGAAELVDRAHAICLSRRLRGLSAWLATRAFRSYQRSV